MRWNLKPARRSAAVLASGAVALAVGCSDFLDVDDPGRYQDDALNTPIALAAVANGVQDNLTSAISGYSYNLGHMSDEYMHTGTWNPHEDVERGRTPTLTNQGNGQSQGTWLSVRTASQKAQERFTTVMGDSANRALLMARVAATEGWANLMLGMNNCESPKAPDGEIVSDIEMYKLAIPLLTRAATIAQASGNTQYKNWAIGGRARANLFAGNFDAALADAQTIPDSYVFYASFTSTGTGAQNDFVTLSYRGRNKAAGLDQRHWASVDTIAGFMRDPWTNALDKRLPITHPRNERGGDGVTQHYNEEVYRDPGDDIPMVHGWEMRLIEAEVYWRKGDLVKAMERINYVRANANCYTCVDKNPAGLASLAATTDANRVLDYLLRERFASLFLQSGQRMNDLYRFNKGKEVLGPNRPMKFPLTSNEIQLNSHVNGSLVGRCLPMSGA